MGKGGFGGQAKYKRVTDMLFGENGINRHKLSDLLQFALLTPGKLDKIGKYLVKRGTEALSKKKIVYVLSQHVLDIFKIINLPQFCWVNSHVDVVMIAFNELIGACHSDLALFAVHVIEIIELLLKTDRVDLKAKAVETVRRIYRFVNRFELFLNFITIMLDSKFIKFAEHGGLQYELERFVVYFFQMASNKDSRPEILHQYVSF